VGGLSLHPQALPSHAPDSIELGYFYDPRPETRSLYGLINEDRYELHIPLNRGNATLTSDGKPLFDGLVLPGIMRLAAPGEEVRGVVSGPVECVFLSIPGPRLRSTIPAGHRPGSVSFVQLLQQPRFEVEQLGRLLLSAKHLDPVHAPLFVEGITDALLACLFYHHGVTATERRATKGLRADEFRRVVDFAEAHLETTLNLQSWAAVLGMPSSEFTRRFRVATGTSPYAWFMQRRIERAKELLRSTSALSLCDISIVLGFSSQSHFTEAFRQRVGTSPAHWRQVNTSRIARST
jgi:AraC family transcriptional regulator